MAFCNLRQNPPSGRLVLNGRFVEVYIDLRRIVTAAMTRSALHRHPFDERCRFRIASEEFLADIRAALGLERLVFAVDTLIHQLHQQARRVLREQRIPVAAPNTLDDVPARATSKCLQFLNDLAVAAHRSVGMRLQLMTKIRLSSFSYTGMRIAPVDSEAHPFRRRRERQTACGPTPRRSRPRCSR